jgi:predicted NAD-dependent protein-ADP-ribosyltransferase YbiA (DUF1768 family)
MRAQLKDRMIIIVAEDSADRNDLAQLARQAEGHVFALNAKGGRGCMLSDLGARETVCRVPINITWAADERWRPISNLAKTPFGLHGRRYASVEGFWQGLKFDEAADRQRIGAMYGAEAKLAGSSIPERATFSYEGKTIAVGRPEHWLLMREACLAKFSQHSAAREALLATGERPLEHRVRRDSRTIPGVVMADIWMRVRSRLRKRAMADDD